MALAWGKSQRLTEVVPAPSFDIADATFRFDIGRDYRQMQLLTVGDADISRSVESKKLTFSLLINGGNLATVLESEKTHSLKWQLTITPSGSGEETVHRGSVRVTPAYSDVVPPDAEPSFYITTEQIDTAGALQGQGLIFDADLKLVPGNVAGGSGSYTQTFTDADLSIADLLPVPHNLSRYPAGVFVQDADGEQVGPDGINVTSLNAVVLDLTSFRPLIGTWRVQIT